MREGKSLGRQFFEDLYQHNNDPWNFASSAYEQEKYEHTLAALDDASPSQVLEVGCSIGVLTEKLAAHCDRLVATDISQTALDQAKSRCATQQNIQFRLVSSAAESFKGVFDLILLSEVVYYWDDADLDEVAKALKSAILPGGYLLMVHWLGQTDYPKSGDEAIEGLAERLKNLYVTERAERNEKYRLDLWRWNPSITP